MSEDSNTVFDNFMRKYGRIYNAQANDLAILEQQEVARRRAEINVRAPKDERRK